MDQFYTHEAGAYQALKELQGQGIPHYHGSYSISLPPPVESHRNREVRMVLLEYIQGIPMSRVEPEKLYKASRQRIISSIVELEGKIYANNMCLNDLYPRNVILIDHESPDPSVVFVDFDDASFQWGKDDYKGSYVSERCLGQYMSPLIRWIPCPEDFDEWVDWDWDSWLRQEFAWTESSITPEIREDFGFY